MRVLADLNNLSEHRDVAPFHFAIVQAGLGDKEQALAKLEGTLADRSAWLPFFKMHPYLDTLRGEPRFGHLLEAMRL